MGLVVVLLSVDVVLVFLSLLAVVVAAVARSPVRNLAVLLLALAVLPVGDAVVPPVVPAVPPPPKSPPLPHVTATSA